MRFPYSPLKANDFCRKPAFSYINANWKRWAAPGILLRVNQLQSSQGCSPDSNHNAWSLRNEPAAAGSMPENLQCFTLDHILSSHQNLQKFESRKYEKQKPNHKEHQRYLSPTVNQKTAPRFRAGGAIPKQKGLAHQPSFCCCHLNPNSFSQEKTWVRIEGNQIYTAASNSCKQLSLGTTHHRRLLLSNDEKPHKDPKTPA